MVETRSALQRGQLVAAKPVAAPGRQGSQVISRSENPQAMSPDVHFPSTKLTTFIQRARIARNDSVRPSVRHVPVLCPDE